MPAAGYDPDALGQVHAIRGVRQKNGPGNYGEYLPFGTDGRFIDMRSGLDLERELKIGGNHITTIIPNGSTTTVVQKYADQSVTSGFYFVETNIFTEGSETMIDSKLYWVLDSQGHADLRDEKFITIGSDLNNNIEITEVIE